MTPYDFAWELITALQNKGCKARLRFSFEGREADRHDIRFTRPGESRELGFGINRTIAETGWHGGVEKAVADCLAFEAKPAQSTLKTDNESEE